MKTYSVKASDIKRDWHVIDASDRVLGRLATEVARLLMGKHKPMYQPNMDVGDHVVIINASKVKVTGGKEEKKIYYTHSMYPGGLKAVTYGDQAAKFPTRAIEKAVWGMLPHNRLGRDIYGKLRVYAGAEHPHHGQVGGTAEGKEAKA